MAQIDLHKFIRDLQNQPGPGSNAPPRTIRAKDLDDNFSKTTLLEDDKDPPLYDLEYTKDGIKLTRLLPNGTRIGDLLYWNGSEWKILRAVQSPLLHVLTIENGNLAWTATEDC